MNRRDIISITILVISISCSMLAIKDLLEYKAKYEQLLNETFFRRSEIEIQRQRHMNDTIITASDGKQYKIVSTLIPVNQEK